MAITELFRQIGQEYLVRASKIKDEEVSQLYQEAASLSLKGKFGEAREKGEAAQALLEQSSILEENNQILLKDFVPRIIGELKEQFGIEEPPVEFLKRVAGEIRLPPQKREIQPKKFALTRNQCQAARAIFGLVDIEAKEFTFDDVLWIVYQEELAEGRPIHVLRSKARGRFKYINKKIEGIFGLLSQEGQPARLPLDITKLQERGIPEETCDIFKRLNEIEEYQGMTLEDLISRVSPGRRRQLKWSRKKEVEPVSPYALTLPETYYLAHEIVMKFGDNLPEDDINAVDTIADDLEEKVEIKNSERLKQGLYRKLLSCRKDKKAFFDAQNESGHLLLPMVVDKSPEELQDLLSLK